MRRYSPRPVLVVMAVVTLVAALLTTHTASAEPRWVGYKIAKNGKAAGGWIGGHKVGGKVAYRFKPAAKPPAGKWSKVRVRSKVKSRKATARAAWIISKYGTYRDRAQAAAVQVALHHLLAGKKWRIGAKAQKRRMKQSGNAANIRRLAKVMVKQSGKRAGPFKIQVTSTRPTVGAAARVSVRVRSRSGKAVKKLPVSIALGSATPRRAVTAKGGKATVTFPKPSAGKHKVTVKVERLPATQLRVRVPKRGSQVALAGGKTTTSQSHTAIVRALPTIKLKPKKSIVKPGKKLKGPFRVRKSLGKQPRSAVVTLHGPYSSKSAANCSGAAVAKKTRKIRGNPKKMLAPARVKKRGFYVWRVKLAGNSLNAPVTVCGGRAAVKSKPRLAAQRMKKAYRVGSKPRARLVARKLVNYSGGTASVKLYGPFNSRNAVRCVNKKKIRKVSLAVKKNSKVKAPPVKVTARGWYGWQAQLPGDARNRSVSSKCGTAASTFRVK